MYLLLWPVPVEPVVWKPSINKGYVADYSRNSLLNRSTKLSMGNFSGPEAAIVLPSGDVIATSHEGWLVKYNKGLGQAVPWVELGGRPLGLDVGADGNIWVANAYLGLQKVDMSGNVSLVLDEVEGTAIKYADDVAWAANGKLYLSDATMRFPAQEWGGTYPASILDIVEHDTTGRIIEFDPKSRQAKIIKADLSFANGVAASLSDDYILVNETGEYRVWKIWIEGERKGESEVILDALPGFPDNIARGLNRNFWLGIVSPRSKAMDDLAGKPFLRKVMMRLPSFMQPEAKHYGMVIEIGEDGAVLSNLQSPNGELFTTTGVAETDESLFITSLTAPFLARLSKADLKDPSLKSKGAESK